MKKERNRVPGRDQKHKNFISFMEEICGDRHIWEGYFLKHSLCRWILFGQEGLKFEVITFPDQLNNFEMCVSNIVVTKLSITKRETSFFMFDG